MLGELRDRYRANSCSGLLGAVPLRRMTENQAEFRGVSGIVGGSKAKQRIRPTPTCAGTGAWELAAKARLQPLSCSPCYSSCF